jgi:polar amino acid transport system permease protein
MKYEWDFSFLVAYYPLLLQGLLHTIELALISLACGMAAGLLLGMARSSNHAAVRLPATCFVEIFRNIPVLVILFWFYFVLPILTGAQTPPFAAAVAAFTAYFAAYSAEIFRAGIESVERGQWEAARSIGFGYFGSMRYCILPQAFQRVVPALTTQSIELVKTTALASTIAYGDILYQAKIISDQELRPLEAYTVAAAIFIAMLVVFSFLSTRVEKHLARSEEL